MSELDYAAKLAQHVDARKRRAAAVARDLEIVAAVAARLRGTELGAEAPALFLAIEACARSAREGSEWLRATLPLAKGCCDVCRQWFADHPSEADPTGVVLRLCDGRRMRRDP